MSMTLAIEAGIASYVGVGAAVAADGAGSEAARAAAIDVAAIFFFRSFRGYECLACHTLVNSIRTVTVTIGTLVTRGD